MTCKENVIITIVSVALIVISLSLFWLAFVVSDRVTTLETAEINNSHLRTNFKVWSAWSKAAYQVGLDTLQFMEQQGYIRYNSSAAHRDSVETGRWYYEGWWLSGVLTDTMWITSEYGIWQPITVPIMERKLDYLFEHFDDIRKVIEGE